MSFSLPLLLCYQWVLVGLFHLSVWGMGLLVQPMIEKEMKPGSAYMTGFIILMPLTILLGLVKLYHSGMFVALGLIGLGGVAYHRSSVMACFGFLVGKLRENKFGVMLIGVTLFLYALRGSAPPYFIDTCQYHFSLGQEYLRSGGIVDLPHHTFGQMMTTFFPETLYVWGLALSGPSLAQMIHTSFAILVLVQLSRALSLYEGEKLFLPLALIVFSCDAFFKTSIYSKTELFQILILFECLIRFKDFGEGRQSVLGLALPIFMLPLLKINLGIVLIPLIVIALLAIWKSTLGFRPYITFFLWGIFLFGIFVLKNITTHGVPLFPLLVPEGFMPEVYEKGAMSLFEDLKFDIVDKVVSVGQQLWGGESYFGASWLTYFLLVGLFLFPRRHKMTWTLIWAFCLGYVSVLTLIYPFTHSVFRVTLPLWILAIIPLGISIQDRLPKKGPAFLLALALLSWGNFMLENGRYLPGIKYHLGMRSLESYYRANGHYLGATIQAFDLSRVESTGRMAVYSEFPLWVDDPRAFAIRSSRVFDHASIKDSTALMEAFKAEGVELLFVDHGLLDLKKMEESTVKFNQRILRALEMGRLKILQQDSFASLCRIMR